MPSVCFYFQVHQPYRLKKYSYFDIGKEHFYEDELNIEILNKVAEKCYLKTNKLLLSLINKHNGKFKISFSISGTALDQFARFRPDVLNSFKKLAETGCVEFLGETYYHSLSYLFSKNNFRYQVDKHGAAICEHFGLKPTVFRNTELIYNNELACDVEKLGFKGILSEGTDKLLNGRSCNFIYNGISTKNIKILLKNHRLSDDIAFRFSDKNWSEFPLTNDKFKNWIHAIAGNGETINLFMDYETFGEHQWESSGIFKFLEQLPDSILSHPDFNFKTPSEVIETYDAKGVYDAHDFISWADSERDLSAWMGNSMQNDALQKIFSLESKIMECDNDDLKSVWHKLQTSDHFYYMCTKFWKDGDVHKYFSPYESPYDAYIYYMNVFSDLEYRVNKMIEKKKSMKSTVYQLENS